MKPCEGVKKELKHWNCVDFNFWSIKHLSKGWNQIYYNLVLIYVQKSTTDVYGVFTTKQTRRVTQKSLPCVNVRQSITTQTNEFTTDGPKKWDFSGIRETIIFYKPHSNKLWYSYKTMNNLKMNG